MKRRAVVVVLGALWIPASLVPLAALSPENVLVVVNRRSEISQRIGEHYMRRRSIPPENLCPVRSRPEETIDREEYGRLASQIEECVVGLRGKKSIAAIVTTKGVPLRVRGATGVQGDAAAVDSELTLLYRRIEGESPPVKGRLANPFFGRFQQPFDQAKLRMFLVTRLTGFTFEDVRGMIDRSVEARNEGFFVLDLADVSAQQGNNWLKDAARILPASRVILDRSRDPAVGLKGVIGYGGWGSNDPRRAEQGLRDPGFGWLPGGVANEYVSTNARTFREPPPDWRIAPWKLSERFFGGSPQSLTGDLIRQGASAASGHVYEPQLGGTPRPQYLFPAYYQGRSLAESFYLAIPFLSWMNVVVGDPLMSLGPPPRRERD